MGALAEQPPLSSLANGVLKFWLLKFVSILITRTPFRIMQNSLFICVNCGLRSLHGKPSREGMACYRCGATWRARAMVLSVLQSLGHSGVPLSDLITNSKIRGIGISDHKKIATTLAKKFDYVNTYFHKAPHLDLTSVDASIICSGTADFLICSDVLEHIPAPIETALQGIYCMLAKGGVAIISVPYKSFGSNDEFYPDLVSYEVQGNQISWVDSLGVSHIDTEPEFHGGSGQTLAFRLWALSDLKKALHEVGFTSIDSMCCDIRLGVPPLESNDDIMLIARK